MTHTVRAGETLSSIAKKYETTVEALVASNGIKNKDIIFAGQLLRIPTKQTTKPAANNQVYNALVTCLDAIENLPEFKTLCKMLGV